jgi:16S rRNA G966 N2-methylase RsmD
MSITDIIKNFYNKNLYIRSDTYICKYNIKYNINKFKLTSDIKSDTNNWKDNNFMDKYYNLYTKNFVEILPILQSLNMYIFFDKPKIAKATKFLKYINKFFIYDNDQIITIKYLLYYIPDIFPIQNICIIQHNISDEILTNYTILDINITNESFKSLNINIKHNYKYQIIYLDSNNEPNNRIGLYEYFIQQNIFRGYIFALTNLEEHGTLIIKFNDIFSNLTIELISLISESFTEITILNNIFKIIGIENYYIFHNYNNNLSSLEISKLIKIAKKWYTKEPSLGDKLNFKQNKYLYSYIQKKKFDKHEISYFVKSLNIPINKHTFIKNNNNKSQLKIIKNANILIKINKIIKNTNNSISKIYKLNINYTIQFLRMLSINFDKSIIKKYYTLKDIILPIYTIKNNKIINIDINKMSITEESKYSVTRPVEANVISNMILREFNFNSIILDGTSNIGGNVISFSKYFKNIIGIEYKQHNFDALKKNIKLYNIKNVEIIHGDTLEYFEKLKYDILFLDPEWGGPAYKQYDLLDLKLGNLPIYEIIKIMKKLGKLGIVFKLPINFKINNDFLLGEKMCIHKIRNYYFIIIRLHS